MSTALFQCLNDDVVMRLATAINMNPPNVKFKQYPLIFERCLGISFEGDSNYMYCWSMDFVMNFSGYAAFIGVDERKRLPVDKYNISVVDSLPWDYKLRSFQQTSYFNLLVVDFTKTLKMIDFGYEDIYTICDRCFIGNDRVSVEKCAKVIHWFVTNPNMWKTPVDIARYINGFGLEVYSGGRFNTMARCMVHFCYLRLRRFRKW